MADSSEIDREKLQRAYARLKGLQNAIPTIANAPGALARDFNSIAEEIGQALGEDVSPYCMSAPAIFAGGSGTEYCNVTVLRSKAGQLVSYLELGHHIGSQVVEIGSLYNSIQDQELKDRCSDLLSAASNFDRVINQATLVLEDRIRTKASAARSLSGTQLVNAVLKTDLSETVLKVSDDPSEHEGVCHICRGIMLTFRNPTHHHITDKFTREDALKVCAFIDDLLRVIDEAVLVN